MRPFHPDSRWTYVGAIRGPRNASTSAGTASQLDVDIAEARFDLRDLREILSHTLVPYTQQTGKVVIKEHDRMRQIELRARISKRLLGQERLPLGPNKLLGQHFPIPVGMKVEVKPEEGE